MQLPDWHSPREILNFILHSTKRIVVLVVGVGLVVLGFALILLPGPFSIPLIVAGLAVLATEYVWAQRALDTVKDKAQKATNVVKRSVFRPKTKDPAD